MNFTKRTKDTIKYQIIESLKPEKEINKIIVFGSFLASKNPIDIIPLKLNSSNSSFLSEIEAGEIIYER